MKLRQTSLTTPMGRVHLVTAPAGLCALSWEAGWEAARLALARRFGTLQFEEDPYLGGIPDLLRAYFNGALGALGAIPTDPGGTPFQRRAWAALRQIPAGSTWSYGQQAAFMGRPEAARAVGQANGSNPIPIVVPCHRVVAATGQLGGFSSGLERKRWLLRHEGVLAAQG